MKVIIPARMTSKRFPGKPLAMIAGKTLVQRVVERCATAVGIKNVLVATDSPQVRDHAALLGATGVLTSRKNLTGTDRVAEVMRMLGIDRAINVQGDEPLIDPSLIAEIAAVLADSNAVVHAYSRIESNLELASPSVPKVLVGVNGDLLFASRTAIPVTKSGIPDLSSARKQVCVYGLSIGSLGHFGPHAKKSPIEEVEDIEILRFLEFGHRVRMIETHQQTIAVDFPDDVLKVEALIEAGS